jgi:putative Mn2+ efflux pump MntP
VRQLLLSAGLLAPLALDTFVLAAALGAAGLEGRGRVRVAVVFTGFEAGMPIIGMLAGRVIGGFLGRWAGYGGIVFLVIAGILLLRPGEREGGEARRLSLLAHAQGLAVLDLGLSISVDELSLGLGAGLIGLPLVATVAWIAVQALAATLVGLRVGSRLKEEVRERAEWLAGAMLILVAVLLLALRLHPL